MFGKNQIVGQSYFKDAAADQLFVTSRFITLQGEGPYRGQPAFFIRLAKCNLACNFCDTFFDDGDWMTFDQIDQTIDETITEYFNGNVPEYATWGQLESVPVEVFRSGAGYITEIQLLPSKRKMVLVITGGEPMLQKNLGRFLERMNQQFENTQIESNGTIVQTIPDSTTLVVSPKCAEKNGISTKYLTPRSEMLARADCLKFVMSADENSPYSEIPEWAIDWKKSTNKMVFVSPMNIYNVEPQRSKQLRSEKNDIDIKERSKIDEVISFWTPGLLNMERNQQNHEYVAKYCIRHGLTLNIQIHLLCSLA